MFHRRKMPMLSIIPLSLSLCPLALSRVRVCVLSYSPSFHLLIPSDGSVLTVLQDTGKFKPVPSIFFSCHTCMCAACLCACMRAYGSAYDVYLHVCLYV